MGALLKLGPFFGLVLSALSLLCNAPHARMGRSICHAVGAGAEPKALVQVGRYYGAASAFLAGLPSGVRAHGSSLLSITQRCCWHRLK